MRSENVAVAPSARNSQFATRTRHPLVMGILNVTPDSFSDGGLWLDPSGALERAGQMVAQGAGVIDVGPESTRPGSDPVSGEEQIARAVPVIRAVREAHPQIVISIDTRLASVAQAAMDAGADVVNDISALRDDPALAGLIAQRRAGVVLMHMKGQPQTMQSAGGGPTYDDVVTEVKSFLAQRIEDVDAKTLSALLDAAALQIGSATTAECV
ncbi:MAG: dihydropteroate synthase [Phycisphaerae bacterium]